MVVSSSVNVAAIRHIAITNSFVRSGLHLVTYLDVVTFATKAQNQFYIKFVASFS